MKILYLCADVGVPIRGHKGASIHVRSLVNAFAKLGHQVTLVSPRLDPEEGPAPMARLLAAPYAAPSLQKSAPAREQIAIEAAASVYRLARDVWQRESFDFIYERYSLWSDAGARLAQSFHAPLVVEVNAPLRVEAAQYRQLFHHEQAAQVEARVFSQATAISVVSSPLRDYVLRQGARAPHVHVLPNAVDEQIFHPGVSGEQTRLDLGLSDKFVIGFVGTAKPWHDLDTLMEAFARLRASQKPVFSPTRQSEILAGGENGFLRQTASRQGALELLLVGKFPDSVRAAIAQRGLADATTIVGPVSNAEVPAYIAAMDVAVSPHPALDAFYFSPLKLFEYMACGVATVAANLPSIAEIVGDGETARLYPPGDAAALAEKIASLATDRAARARLGWQGARDVLGLHTWQRNAQQIIAWLAPEISRSAAQKLDVRSMRFSARGGDKSPTTSARKLLVANMPLRGMRSRNDS